MFKGANLGVEVYKLTFLGVRGGHGPQEDFEF